MASRYLIGIDLYTTNSVVAIGSKSRWISKVLRNRHVCRAIATALQTCWSDFDLLALFAHAAHQRG